jgi:hypothetical protein
MPNTVPAAHLVAGSRVLEYEPEVRNTATSKQNVEGTAK